MFIRQDKKGGASYLSICKNYRDKDNKIRQVYLRSLGKLSDYQADELRQVALRLYQLGGGDAKDLTMSTPKELGRYNYGFPYVLRKLMLDYGLDKVFHRLERRYRLSYDVFSIVLLLLCDRFNDPLSKLASHDYQSDYVGMVPVKLHHIYRSLEKIGAYKEVIQRHLYQQHYRHQSYTCDVVFYDVTTFYFDSQVEQTDSLRQKGFGKDGKIGKTKVVFGMLIDRHKNPIAYQVYKGNQYEGHTMSDVLQKLKKQYRIGKVVVVADRGMMNKNNVSLFAEGGDLADYEYIIGERLKNSAKPVKDYLTNLANYESHSFEDENGETIQLKCCRYNHQGKTIIGTYSTKRAKKDRLEREARIAKALEMTPAQLQKKAKRYYLKAAENQQFILDQKRIKEAARFDGFMAIATSDAALSDLEIIDQYKHLYQIEQSFRTFKSYLEIRPMFHWTDTRIEGHICICYIAYCLLNYLQQQLRAIKQPHSERHIRRLLSKMQVSKVELGAYPHYMRAAMDEATEALLGLFKLHKMTDFMPERKLGYYFDKICSGKLKKLKH